ncbi:Hypothetical protein PHPALM_20471, partial [Phytophthora palmivora]
MKAPGSDADDQYDLKTAWIDESLEIAYHKKELHTFLIKNPVMQIIKPKIISDLKGPVQKPTARSSKLEAAKATINTALMSIFDLLKPLVGEKNVTPKITTRSTNDMLNMTQGSNAKLESYFQAAMSRFLKEQQGAINPVIAAPAEDRDVDMEAWLNKAKSAFVRNQAPDEEKCLVFGDLLTGSARNWYRQLSRTTRSTWKDLLRSFQ